MNVGHLIASQPAETRGRYPLSERFDAEFEAEVRRLQSESEAERVAAAKALGRCGGRAVEPLCQAMSDPVEAARIASAEALGAVGDARAVGVLGDALRACFVSSSPRWQLIAGALVILGAALAFVSLGWIALLLKWSSVGWLIFQISVSPARAWFAKRRARSKEANAIARALVNIAERDPAPEVRAVLPDLQVISVDLLHQEGSTRKATRSAARRIERLTAQLKSLPVPSAPSAQGDELASASFPLPSHAEPPDVATLPMVSGSKLQKGQGEDGV